MRMSPSLNWKLPPDDIKWISAIGWRRIYNFSMVTAPIDTAPYSEAARRILRPEDCALAVIDIQEKLLTQIFEKERVLRNAQLLIRLAEFCLCPSS